MHQTEVETFTNTLAKTHTWLKEIMDDMGWREQHAAYLALKGVLHSIRDRLPISEVIQLGAQLPMLVRGLYYEGWHAAGKPGSHRHEEEFLADSIKYFGKAAQASLATFDPGADAEAVVRSVFGVLSRHTTEAATIRQLLPTQIRALWPAQWQA